MIVHLLHRAKKQAKTATPLDSHADDPPLRVGWEEIEAKTSMAQWLLVQVQETRREILSRAFAAAIHLATPRMSPQRLAAPGRYPFLPIVQSLPKIHGSNGSRYPCFAGE